MIFQIVDHSAAPPMDMWTCYQTPYMEVEHSTVVSVDIVWLAVEFASVQQKVGVGWQQSVHSEVSKEARNGIFHPFDEIWKKCVSFIYRFQTQVMGPEYNMLCLCGSLMMKKIIFEKFTPFLTWLILDHCTF